MSLPFKSYHTTTPNGFDLQISYWRSRMRNRLALAERRQTEGRVVWCKSEERISLRSSMSFMVSLLLWAWSCLNAPNGRTVWKSLRTSG